ncbi:IS30 family transposase [Rhizobium sp. BK418]|nr:IS30 family transposase [Rhizobium sp. BK418]
MSRCYTQLALADRRRLQQLMAANVPVHEMARQLGRHRSTIYREIKRNTFHDRELPDYDGYYSTVAHDISKDRRRRLRKLRRHPNLRRRSSPSWRHAGLLSRSLVACCWRGAASCASVKRQSTGSFTARKITGLASISISRKRAANVVHYAPGSRATVCFRPRIVYPYLRTSTRPCQCDISGGAQEPLYRSHQEPSRHSRPIMDEIIRAFSPLPAFARQSFTFDRGTEFAGFRALEEGIGARSWFCDPSAPWQKGTVENANKRRPRCSWRICRIRCDPLPCKTGVTHLG